MVLDIGKCGWVGEARATRTSKYPKPLQIIIFFRNFPFLIICKMNVIMHVNCKRRGKLMVQGVFLPDTRYINKNINSNDNNSKSINVIVIIRLIL